MADLEFVRISADGTRIIVRDAQGVESELPMDDRLAAALIPRTAPAPDVIALTPREIQARIRAGADVETLATQTSTPAERIMAFAVPILQERAHIASRARETLMRRGQGVGPLGQLVQERLAPLGVTADPAAWDARRLEDGTWEVRFSYESREGVRHASWRFDARAAVLNPMDDEAHWLVGEPPSVPPATETVTKPTLPVFRPVQGPVDNVVPMKRRDDEGGDAPEDPEPPRGGRRRKSVPSWDEILFGAPTDPE